LISNNISIQNTHIVGVRPYLTERFLDTSPNVGIVVPGILAPAEVDGESVSLMPYFSGELASTNRGDRQGTAVNFFDGGGSAPLLQNKPADDETSNQ
jgi:hypothetical protein